MGRRPGMMLARWDLGIHLPCEQESPHDDGILLQLQGLALTQTKPRERTYR